MVQTIKPGVLTGTVAFKVVSLGAKIYNWRYALASTPDALVNVPPTSAANTLVTGLTPGLTYLFQCSAANSAGMSNWSAAYSQMVL